MNLRNTSLILCGLAVVLLAVLQFLPWAQVKTEGGTVPGFSGYGFSTPDTTYPGSTTSAETWGIEVSSDNGRQGDEGWYSSEFDGEDGEKTETGIVLIRVAIPFLGAGLLLLGAGALATALLPRGLLGPLLALLGGLLAIVGTVLFSNGVDETFEGNAYTWLAGLYVAIAACAVGLAGGVAGLLAQRTATTGAAAA